MPLDRYAAFLSYAHRHADWVKVLQANLERCLAHAGRPGQVFLDQVDLGSGRSWVGQLQAGLARAEHFVLVRPPRPWPRPGWRTSGRASWRPPGTGGTGAVTSPS